MTFPRQDACRNQVVRTDHLPGADVPPDIARRISELHDRLTVWSIHETLRSEREITR